MSNDNTRVESSEQLPEQSAKTIKDTQPSKRARTKKLNKEIDTLRKENSELKDQLLRKLAEFDNYRKRVEREYGEIILRANGTMIQKLLPIIDDIERSMSQSGDDSGKEDFKKGIELIYSKFYKILEEAGIKPIETDGKEFDPEIHEALMQLENKDVPSNHIIETIEKGYYLNDRIIRHAKVSVSK